MHSELLPSMFGPNMSRRLNKELSELSDSVYYDKFKDKPISITETDTLFENYNRVITITGSTIMENPVDVIAIYYSMLQPNSIEGELYTIRRGLIYDDIKYIRNDELEIDGDYADHRIVRVDVATSLDDTYSFPDIQFIHEVYRNRTSLMNINPFYAKIKTIEFYNHCSDIYNDDSYKMYIYLTSQCLALNITLIKIKSKNQIENIDDIVLELKDRVERWLHSL